MNEKTERDLLRRLPTIQMKLGLQRAERLNDVWMMPAFIFAGCIGGVVTVLSAERIPWAVAILIGASTFMALVQIWMVYLRRQIAEVKALHRSLEDKVIEADREFILRHRGALPASVVDFAKNPEFSAVDAEVIKRFLEQHRITV